MNTKNFTKPFSALLIIAGFAFIGFCGCGGNPPKEFPREITPILVAQGELYGNGQEGIAEQNSVIKMQNGWSSLLESMNSVNDVSESFTETDIDFNNCLVIAVFDEVRGNSGCSISIKSITEYADSIVVDVQKVVTVNGADVMNQPFYIAKIPVTNKSIVFEYSVLNDTVPDDTIPTVIINLLGMDTVTIQNYIEGKWQVIYFRGGLCGYHCIWYPSVDVWVEFTNNKQYIEGTFNGTYVSQLMDYYFTTIHPYNPDKFALIIPDHLWSYIPWKIKNDTLVYYDFGSDPRYYHCVKLNN